MSKVREAIRKAITRGQKTRYRLCKETGVDKAAMTRFMGRRPGLSLENLEKIADALGLEIIIRPRQKGK